MSRNRCTECQRHALHPHLPAPASTSCLLPLESPIPAGSQPLALSLRLSASGSQPPCCLSAPTLSPALPPSALPPPPPLPPPDPGHPGGLCEAALWRGLGLPHRQLHPLGAAPRHHPGLQRQRRRRRCGGGAPCVPGPHDHALLWAGHQPAPRGLGGAVRQRLAPAAGHAGAAARALHRHHGPAGCVQVQGKGGVEGGWVGGELDIAMQALVASEGVPLASACMLRCRHYKTCSAAVCWEHPKS